MLSPRSLLLCMSRRGLLSRHVYEPRLVIANAAPVEGSSVVDEKKPVILLLGWAGAQQSHINKYADIYNQEGYRTVSLIAPCYHNRIPNSRIGFYMSPLFLGINAKPGNFIDFKNSPIIVHSFSMNGVRSLISLWKWTEAEQKKFLRDRIKGIVFDSSPARTLAGPDARAVVISTPPIEALQSVSEETRINYLQSIFTMYNGLVHTLIAFIPPLRSYLSLYYYLMDNIRLPTHQLYLYSQADDMIRHKYVNRFADHQKTQGKDVTTVDFVDSEHVKHQIKYPDRYGQACVDFVKKVEKSLNVS